MLETAFLCLALNLYHEARHLPDDAQMAVGHVVLNRVDDKRFPSSVCEVVTQGGEKLNRCQFSWYCDGKPDTPYNKKEWTRSLKNAVGVLEGEDTTDGALFYHAPYVMPRWAKVFRQTRVDQGHIFYKVLP